MGEIKVKDWVIQMDKYTREMLLEIDEEIEEIYQVPEVPEGPSDNEWYEILFAEWQSMIAMAEDYGTSEDTIIYLN